MSSSGRTVYMGRGSAGNLGFAGSTTGGGMQGVDYNNGGSVPGYPPVEKPRGGPSRPPVKQQGGGQGGTQ